MSYVHPLYALALVWWLPGCSDDPAGTGSGGGGGAAGTEDVGPDIDTLIACRDVNFTVARELSGPEYDLAQGGLTSSTPQPSYIVHTTQVFVKDDKIGEFLTTNSTVTMQLETTPGLIGYSLANDTGCGDFRTLGIWASEEAMYAFAGSGAHAVAMTKIGDLSWTGRVTHWTASADEVNTLEWDFAKDTIATVDAFGDY